MQVSSLCELPTHLPTSIVVSSPKTPAVSTRPTLAAHRGNSCPKLLGSGSKSPTLIRRSTIKTSLLPIRPSLGSKTNSQKRLGKLRKRHKDGFNLNNSSSSLNASWEEDSVEENYTSTTYDDDESLTSHSYESDEEEVYLEISSTGKLPRRHKSLDSGRAYHANKQKDGTSINNVVDFNNSSRWDVNESPSHEKKQVFMQALLLERSDSMTSLPRLPLRRASTESDVSELEIQKGLKQDCDLHNSSLSMPQLPMRRLSMDMNDSDESLDSLDLNDLENGGCLVI